MANVLLLLLVLGAIGCISLLVLPDLHVILDQAQQVVGLRSQIDIESVPATANEQRQLQLPESSRTSWFTGESLVTYNGKVPAVTCPKGTYRIPSSSAYSRASGQRIDGCEFCPRGRFGDVTGLTTRMCSDACPKGRYRDTPGARSANECRLCPPGKIGSTVGMTTSECTANCPVGMYNDESGATSERQCKLCPTGYRGWQCTWPQDPRKGTYSTFGGAINEAAHIYVNGAPIPQGASPVRFEHTYTPLRNTEDPIVVSP